MPQELSTKMMEPLKNPDEVRPFDKVTVYATGTGGGYHNEGEALELHPALAASFIAAGKATAEPPKSTKKKGE